MSERAALLDGIHPTARAVFEQAGFEVVTFPKSVEPQELAAVTSNVRILGVRSGPNVPAEAMSDSLEVITVYGVGTDHITRSTQDGRGADERGIAIFNAAHENTRSVAELVIGSAFALARGIAEHNRQMHDGVWTKEDGQELRGKTMGILGYGAIGGQVSVLAEAVGMDVVYHDPAPQIPPQGRARLLESQEAVLAKADILTLHVPGGSANSDMINSKSLSLMKPGSFLINAARADLVDYKAVAKALKSGQLGGVAVDVYAKGGVKEPARKGQAFEHLLRGLPNVILTPHIGGSTVEAQQSIGQKVAQRAVLYLRTGNTTGSVNLPQVPLNGLEAGTIRLLNVHHNHPGVMAKLTALVAEAGLNLVSGVQKARGEIGYAALDVEGKVSSNEIDDVLTVMRALHATYLARVIR